MGAPTKAAGPGQWLCGAETNHPILTDGVILIRPMTPHDVDAHVAGHDKEQARWLSGFPSTPETVLKWIQQNQKSWKNGGPICNFGIVEIASGQLIGMVEANAEAHRMVGVDDGEANIAYAIYPFARRQGYATRAVNLMLTFLDGKPFTAAVIRAAPKNKRSRRVASRCGFVRTGKVLSLEPAGFQKLKVYHHTLG
jgi:RimJ/RimL family protein N-acetyltransferase